ncbi:Gfo/Idh/MocA family protein [Neobacillus soli]|uniref:Gfo/Idh/MocA family protein n=1 Tax=Neobacillus soli TaxID=220688 RepID=UPI0008253F05|nr:Gfo/Idh/MocA family oxidoreductase [Neobacillus soli]
MKKVNVGIVGSGFIAAIHIDSYKKVFGIDVCLKAVASTNKMVQSFADKYGIEKIYTRFDQLLEDTEIDVVDICTPAHFHEDMIIRALEAGKHVICEKPMTGFYGTGDANIGHTVSKKEMYHDVMKRMDKLREVAEQSGKLFMYAENWVYAPSITKCAEIIKARKSKVLLLKGEESHSGSHAAHAALWAHTGGGALIRQGCHPLSAVLYLKQVEAQARNEEIHIESIVAEVGNITNHLSEQDRGVIAARPVDVEDWANVSITFSDGTKAAVMAGDMIVGGVRNLVEVFTPDSAHICNMTPNNHALSYFANERNLEDIFISEKVETKQGWQFVSPMEEYVRGYVDEFQDFMECIAFGRNPKSDFNLAYDSTKAIYAAYWSAAEGKRIYL